MRLIKVDDCRYECEIGDFYQIFAQNPRSWEFRAKVILKEEELVCAIEMLRMLKSGQMQGAQ